VQNLIKQYAQPVGSSFGTASSTKAWGRQSVTDSVNPSNHNLALHGAAGSGSTRPVLPWSLKQQQNKTATQTAGQRGQNQWLAVAGLHGLPTVSRFSRCSQSLISSSSSSSDLQHYTIQCF
jgi:hypothetical protein